MRGMYRTSVAQSRVKPLFLLLLAFACSGEGDGYLPPLSTGEASGDGATSPPTEAEPSCPAIAPQPVAGQAWAIAGVNFETNEIVFQNVSDTAQVLSIDHQWCSFPFYERIIPLDLEDLANSQESTFQPGERVFVSTELGTGGTDLEATGGEIAMFPAPGTYRDSSQIMNFVAWGDGNALVGRESVAAAAGLWPLGERVPVAESRVGIVAVGTTDRSEGFVSVEASCLP